MAEQKRKFREFIWATYDFADTIFSMNVVSLYFPLLVVSDFGAPDMYVSVANSVSQLLVVFLAPIFGLLSDRVGKRMGFFWSFALGTALGTIAIRLGASMGTLGLVLVSFVVANVSYQLSLTFYNSLLPRVAKPERWGVVSGLGTALGYVGSIAGMAIVMPFNTGSLFGLRVPIPAGGRIATFIPTALLFFAFALPTLIYFWLDERKRKYPAEKSQVQGLKAIFETLSDSKKYPGIRRFLLARLFYQEAVETTIIFMGVFAEKAMGMDDASKIVFFIIATTAAIFGSFLWGLVTDSIGAHRALIYDLIGWVIGLLAIAFFPHRVVFWAVGALLGVMLGGVWTTSRPYLLRLAPRDAVGRFFGLYSMTGKAAAVVGPIVWGATTLLFAPLGQRIAYQAAVAMMAMLVTVGMLLLLGNKEVIDMLTIEKTNN